MSNNEVLIKSNGTPSQMIMEAVANGADLEKLEKLLTLQDRWEANEARKAFHKAMSDFKSTAIEIEKDKKVGYKTDKGMVGYSHATLANVVRTISKELSKYGLSASWRTYQNGTISVTCKITHILGHSEETTLSASADSSGSKNSIQAIGSTITYLERYTLLAMTGLATTEQDDDAKEAEPSDFVTNSQLHTLRDMLIAKERKEAPLVKYLGVKSLEKLPANQYQKAVNAINTKGVA